MAKAARKVVQVQRGLFAASIPRMHTSMIEAHNNTSRFATMIDTRSHPVHRAMDAVPTKLGDKHRSI